MNLFCFVCKKSPEDHASATHPFVGCAKGVRPLPNVFFENSVAVSMCPEDGCSNDDCVKAHSSAERIFWETEQSDSRLMAILRRRMKDGAWHTLGEVGQWFPSGALTGRTSKFFSRHMDELEQMHNPGGGPSWRRRAGALPRDGIVPDLASQTAVPDLARAATKSIVVESKKTPKTPKTPKAAVAKAIVVDSKKTLKTAKAALAKVMAAEADAHVALDCEWARDTLSIVTVATQRGDVFLFDAVAAATVPGIRDVVRDLIERSDVCKVVHDGREDSRHLFRFCGAHLDPVFDTQVAYRFMSQLDGATEAQIGLGPMLEALGLGGSDESQWRRRIQKQTRKALYSADPEYWLRRPLSGVATAYAAEDVTHLLAARETIQAKTVARQTRGPVWLRGFDE